MVKYDIRTRSRLSSGNNAQTPSIFVHPTHALTSLLKPPSPLSRRVMGSKGNSTLFPCIWNEQRKKPHAVLARARESIVF